MTAAHQQAGKHELSVTVREIVNRAGLSDDLGVRPASLTADAARRVFDHSGHIENAASHRLVLTHRRRPHRLYISRYESLK